MFIRNGAAEALEDGLQVRCAEFQGRFGDGAVCGFVHPWV
jgi:hypothetical protein